MDDRKGSSFEHMNKLVDMLMQHYGTEKYIDRMDVFTVPDERDLKEIVTKLMRVLYPGYYRDRMYEVYHYESRLRVLIEDAIIHLEKQLALVIRYRKEYADADEEDCRAAAREIAGEFAARIPAVRDLLETDLQALYDGDPATDSKDEIVMCYPGLYAITCYRIAHELFLLNVPLIPRIITEAAHSRTGIDIHPGATIGKYFFIDHGTGIVVGSSTEIGEHVKLYQGVTLGALSTRKGYLLRGVKRHPTIEDYVTIYSGASILGGETVIGANSVIGSNAFITSSVAPNSRVSMQNQYSSAAQDTDLR